MFVARNRLFYLKYTIVLLCMLTLFLPCFVQGGDVHPSDPAYQGDSYPALANFLYRQAITDWHDWKQSGDAALFQRALFNIDSAITIEPARSEFYLLNGMLLWEMKASPEAVEGALDAFLQAVALNPENGRAQFMTATALFSLGRFDLAFEQWKFLLEKDPAMITGIALSQFTLSAVGSGRQEEGEHLLQALAEQHPDSADIRISLATLLKSRGMTAEAKDQLVDILVEKSGSREKQDYALSLLGQWKKEGR